MVTIIIEAFGDAADRYYRCKSFGKNTPDDIPLNNNLLPTPYTFVSTLLRTVYPERQTVLGNP
jgi:hypothetical protein